MKYEVTFLLKTSCEISYKLYLVSQTVAHTKVLS